MFSWERRGITTWHVLLWKVLMPSENWPGDRGKIPKTNNCKTCCLFDSFALQVFRKWTHWLGLLWLLCLKSKIFKVFSEVRPADPWSAGSLLTECTAAFVQPLRPLPFSGLSETWVPQNPLVHHQFLYQNCYLRDFAGMPHFQTHLEAKTCATKRTQAVKHGKLQYPWRWRKTKLKRERHVVLGRIMSNQTNIIRYILLLTRTSHQHKHIPTLSDAQVLPFCTTEICPHRSCPMREWTISDFVVQYLLNMQLQFHWNAIVLIVYGYLTMSTEYSELQLLSLFWYWNLWFRDQSGGWTINEHQPPHD